MDKHGIGRINDEEFVSWKIHLRPTHLISFFPHFAAAQNEGDSSSESELSSVETETVKSTESTKSGKTRKGSKAKKSSKKRRSTKSAKKWSKSLKSSKSEKSTKTKKSATRSSSKSEKTAKSKSTRKRVTAKLKDINSGTITKDSRRKSLKKEGDKNDDKKEHKSDGKKGPKFKSKEWSKKKKDRKSGHKWKSHDDEWHETPSRKKKDDDEGLAADKHDHRWLFTKLLHVDAADLDDDHSGSVDLEEFCSYFVRTVGVDKALAKRLFHDIDGNGDGDITSKEFEKWKRKHKKPEDLRPLFAPQSQNERKKEKKKGAELQCVHSGSADKDVPEVQPALSRMARLS